MAKREYKSITQHLGQFSSPQTRMTYLSGIGGFFRFIKPDVEDLDAYSVSYLKSHSQNQIEEDIMRFRDSMLGRPAKTRTGYVKSTMGYLEANDVAFKKSWKNNIVGKDTSAVSEEHVPTPQELEKILSFMNLLGRAITLVSCSSGLRIGELLQIRESNVDFKRTPVLVTVPAQYAKGKMKRVTFISQEATKELQKWLDYKPEWIKVTETRTGVPIKDKDKVFCVSYNAFSEIWEGSVTKSGFGKKDITTNRLELRIHNLRKFFRTYGKWTQPDIAEALMGHLGNLEQIYARFPQEQLERAYLEAEPNITIIGSAPNLKELQEEMHEQYRGVDRVIADLSIENRKLQEELKRKDAEFKQQIDTTTKPILDRIDRQQEQIDNLTANVAPYEETYADMMNTIHNLRAEVDVLREQRVVESKKIKKEKVLVGDVKQTKAGG